MFCLRVMVGVIILYDHVHPVGAFAKTSPIDVSFTYSLSSAVHTVQLGYWHQRADERHGSPPPR